ncbi:electron transfer flavoprotein subunit beta/FixA family protein [Halopenitus sp. H-Gu1]|uniref:electron transfer flavoprotein subunit beta/FixA family protein n=1 Tax=Halopenitus sp. H-Gu1 TaxID=3242697 RepID=UPI00359DF7A8
MKVLVTVKEVGEVGDDFAIEGDGIADGDLEYDINEWDEYALEAGVRLAEAEIAEEVVTATIGPERAEETIRTALAKGADRAVRVFDDAIEDAFLDVETRVDILEAIVEAEQPDLVLSGVQASDTAFGATGVALAERIGYQHAAVVNDLEMDADAGVAHVRRELEGGIEELTEADLPAVLTIQTGLNEPRYASLRGIRQAQRKEIDVRTLSDIGLSEIDVEGKVTLSSMYEPESDSDTELIEGDAGEAAARLAEVLREGGVDA